MDPISLANAWRCHPPFTHPSPRSPLPTFAALAAPRHWSIPLTHEQQNRLACGSCGCVALGGRLMPGRPPACPWLMHCTPPGVARQVVPLPGACRSSAALSRRQKCLARHLFTGTYFSFFPILCSPPYTGIYVSRGPLTRSLLIVGCDVQTPPKPNTAQQ